MPFPRNLEELKAAGYTFWRSAMCRACPTRIEFWRTPEQKLIPIEVDRQLNIQPHWGRCPGAKKFRKQEKPSS